VRTIGLAVLCVCMLGQKSALIFRMSLKRWSTILFELRSRIPARVVMVVCIVLLLMLPVGVFGTVMYWDDGTSYRDARGSPCSTMCWRRLEEYPRGRALASAQAELLDDGHA
jgi:hypothetical protein